MAAIVPEMVRGAFQPLRDALEKNGSHGPQPGDSRKLLAACDLVAVVLDLQCKAIERLLEEGIERGEFESELGWFTEAVTLAIDLYPKVQALVPANVFADRRRQLDAYRERAAEILRYLTSFRQWLDTNQPRITHDELEAMRPPAGVEYVDLDTLLTRLNAGEDV